MIVPILLLAAVSSLRASAEPPPPIPVQVPVVLDTTGINGSHFTSDLTVVNLGATPSLVELTFVPPPELGLQLPPVSTELELDPNVRFYLPDVVAYLRERGLALPAGNVLGTLLVRLPQVSGEEAAPWVGSRISTPSRAGDGSFGVYMTGVPAGRSVALFTSVYGLRETETQRSNLAFAHAGGGANRPIELRVQLYEGATGLIVGEPFFVTLAPGEWKQVSSVLNQQGIREGWARITQSQGNDLYIAYAVINDGGTSGGGTSDGSLILTGGTDGLLPVVLSAGPYRTELVLVNDSPNEVLASLVYTPSESLGAANVPGSIPVRMAPRSQMIEPDVLDYLRRRGLGIPVEGNQGGTLRVTGAQAYARVWSPNPDEAVGGSFGVAFPAVAQAKRARRDAWVYGLRQDDAARSNLAIASAAPATEAAASFEVTVYDAVHAYPKQTLTRFLKPGQWYQWNAILAGAGLSEGYARVRCTSASAAACDFVTYGILNDGRDPSSGTSDGSYVPMLLRD